MFITDLFIMIKTWRPPGCPPIDELLNKLWYIPTMEYHLALKIKELASHEKTWTTIKCILISERNQGEKATTVGFQLYDLLGKAKV